MRTLGVASLVVLAGCQAVSAPSATAVVQDFYRATIAGHVNGDLFSSLFEGPNAVEVLTDSARGPARVATVRMTHNGANPPTTWIDHVVLIQQRGRYVIDDIEYGGQWDFASKGTLRSTLVTALGAQN